MIDFVKYLIGLNCLFAVVSALKPSHSVLIGNVHAKIEKLIANQNGKTVKGASSAASNMQVATDDEYNSGDDYSATLDGYFYVSAYAGQSCSTSPIYTFGYRLGQCVTMYDDSLQPIYTVKGSCNTEQFTLGRYDSLDCSGAPSNATFGGINACDQGFEIGESFIALCSSGDKVPVHMNAVVIKGYEGADAATCSSEAEVTVFEAFEQDTCITFDPNSSIKLQCPYTGTTTDNVIDIVYNASTTCTSTHTDYPIVQECSSVGSEEFDYVASLLSFATISGSSSESVSAPGATDDTYPNLVNTTYLYQDISVECFYFTTSKPSSLPTAKPTTATPTMSPTTPKVEVTISQEIDDCTYDSFASDPVSYTEAIMSAITGSIACIDSSMIVSFAATAPPTANPTSMPTTFTAAPSTLPTPTPSAVPTTTPSAVPTAVPTVNPSAGATVSPTAAVSVAPTSVATIAPTAEATFSPSAEPTTATLAHTARRLLADSKASELTDTTAFFSISYTIATSDPSVSASLIESQLQESLNLDVFTDLLQAGATIYNAPGLATASSTTATFTNDVPTNDSNDDDSLSDGEIAGIVIGALVGVFILAGIGYYFYSKSSKTSSSLTSSLTTGASSSHGATTNPMASKAYTPPSV